MSPEVADKVRRRAAEGREWFRSLVRDIDLPPLPAVSARLVAEISQPEPDMERVTTAIASAPETAAKVLRTVNSSMFALRNPVLSVRHAIALLGMRHIKPIALSFAMMEALPRPDEKIFDHQGFWTDSLVRAMFARHFAQRAQRGDEEDAFTAALMADLAVPVLLVLWPELYGAVIQRWPAGRESLTALEKKALGWDHAQAGAWVTDQWKLPPELVCFVGLHNLGPEQIREFDLADTIALPISVAALAPSVGRAEPERAQRWVRAVLDDLRMPAAELLQRIAGVRESFREIAEFFGLGSGRADGVFDLLLETATAESERRPL
ncbi:MAG: HDOD domain-containing protein [Candidatus Eisenbacteria bacterium]|uniref:HDOD domain-containing protein n=1 Tax=Eiseniibacteriota bacterium TaxID=2212470 RepID=A0A938BQ57_UNCEI|nr:HDOD domain-containing protein [Candidatus Eisenbacteria bacterium]